jgi:hypothetical protein
MDVCSASDIRLYRFWLYRTVNFCLLEYFGRWLCLSNGPRQTEFRCLAGSRTVPLSAGLLGGVKCRRRVACMLHANPERGRRELQGVSAMCDKHPAYRMFVVLWSPLMQNFFCCPSTSLYFQCPDFRREITYTLWAGHIAQMGEKRNV